MRPDALRSSMARLAIGGVVAIVLITVGAIAIQRAHPSDVGITQAVLSDASRAVAAHVETMRDGATALRRAAAVGSTGPGGSAAEADRMDAERGQLANVAMILGNQAALLGPEPGRQARPDVHFVHTTGDAVISEANELAAHAKAMLTHAAALDGLAEPNGVRAIDTVLLRRQSATLSATATEMTRVGRLLQQAGDQFMRSLGR